MWSEGEEDDTDDKKMSGGIRASAILLPLLAIAWFLGVVALENPSSVFFQVASGSANITLVRRRGSCFGRYKCPNACAWEFVVV